MLMLLEVGGIGDGVYLFDRNSVPTDNQYNVHQLNNSSHYVS